MTVPGLLAPAQINRRARRPLAQPLIEGVLRLVAVTAPDALPRATFNAAAVRRPVLAEAFHLKLLNPGNKHPQPFVVGKEAVRGNSLRDGVVVGHQGH